MNNFNPDPKPGRLILPLVLIGMIATTYTFINRVAENNDLDFQPEVEVVQEEETEEGDRIANALGDKTVLFLQNHGILTTGPSIDIALWYYFSMERCCQSQLMADAAGETTKIPHETAIKTREFIANDLAAWASFQPLLDMITRKEPDLLD